MAETFNYFSHQKFTPNYIHGIDGEYENVSSATTSAACTTAIEAGNNIMFTGAMGLIDYSATNEVARKDMTYKTGSSMTDGHYINGEHTTINVQAGASAMRMFIFDSAYGGQVNGIGGADFTNINFIGGREAPTLALDDTVGVRPFTFQGTGHETSVVHAGEMTINGSGSGDHTRGDTTNGQGTFHCGYEQYDFLSGPSDHRLSTIDTDYRDTSVHSSPDFVDIRNARVGMTNVSKRPNLGGGQPSVNPGIFCSTRNGDYYYLNNLLAADTNWGQWWAGSSNVNKSHLRNCTSSGYTDADVSQEAFESYFATKSIWNGNQLLEGDGHSTLEMAAFYQYRDDNIGVANSFEMLQLASQNLWRIDSGANDVVTYGNSIQSNNTSYGDVLNNPSDGTVTGNNSHT